MRLRVLVTVVVAASLAAVLGGYASRARATSRPQAAPAAAKPAGYKVVSGPTVSVPLGANVTLKATCPANLVAVGGGELDSSKSTVVMLAGSYPSGQTWVSTLHNGSAATIKAHARAVCITIPAKFKVVNTSWTNLPMSQTEGEADCPAGTFVIGGGVKAGNTSQQAVNSSYTGNGLNWLVFENNQDAVAHNMRAIAVCGKPSYTVVQSSPIASPVDAQASGTVACPAGEVPLSGGASSDSTNIFAEVNASSPTAAGWKVAMNNGTPTASDFTVYAICG